MQLLTTGGFRGWTIQRRHFWLQRSKGRCHGNQILAKIGQKIKNGHNFSCKQHIHAEFGFEIGFVPSGNSSVTLPYTRDKETLPCQAILGLKLLQMHINTFLREIMRMRLLTTGGFHGWTIQRSHFWLQRSKGRCHGNHIFAKKRQKISQKWP